MDKLYAEIGARMRTARKALGLTQAQVAEAAGIDGSFYGQVERGKNIPSLKTFLAVATALSAEPADLLPGRPGGRERIYEGALSRLLRNLSPGKRRVVVGLVGDMVRRL